jgi:hypothetical protein
MKPQQVEWRTLSRRVSEAKQKTDARQAQHRESVSSSRRKKQAHIRLHGNFETIVST